MFTDVNSVSLFWTCIWNIQWRLSFCICILCVYSGGGPSAYVYCVITVEVGPLHMYIVCLQWKWALCICISCGYSGGGPSAYVYCVVCYREIAVPCVRSVDCVFADLYTLVNDLKAPDDYELSLLSSIVSLWGGGPDVANKNRQAFTPSNVF